MQFKFVTPKDIAELEPHMAALDLLALFMPWAGWLEVAIADVGKLTFVYDADNGKPLGVFTLEVLTSPFKTSGKPPKTVELHGVTRQDLAIEYGPEVGPRIMPAFTQLLLKDVFLEKGFEKIILKVPKASPGGRGFAILNGFRAINKEKGSTVYRLTKQEYLEKYGHGKKQPTES